MLTQTRQLFLLLLVLALSFTLVGCRNADSRQSLWPEPRLQTIDPPQYGFFHQQIVVEGIPIKAHRDVAPDALFEAARRIHRQLANIPQAAENLRAAGAEMHVIGKNQNTSDLPYLRHWKGQPYEGDKTIDQRTRGLGGLQASCAEENLLKLPTDPYREHRDICTHEFAHTIFAFGVGPQIRERIRDQYHRSLQQGLWPDAYAATNPDEFFAELSMWYFGSRGDYGHIIPRPRHGRDWLRNYDPDAFALIDDIYSGRLDLGALEFETLTPLPATAENQLRSQDADQHTYVLFINHTDTDYDLFWLDTDGNRKPYGRLYAGQKRSQATYASHPWILADPDGRVYAIFVAKDRPGRVVLD